MNRCLRMMRLVLDIAERKRHLLDLAFEYRVSRRTLQRDLSDLRRMQVEVDCREGVLELSPAAIGRVRSWMGLAGQGEV